MKDVEFISNDTVKIYRTSGEKSTFVEDNSGVVTDAPGSGLTLEIDKDKFYQTIDGFGASFTDSSAYLINQVLTVDKRDELMSALFDPKKGIGLSMLRNPMGSSDYARDYYSYDDMPCGHEDFELKSFSIDHDTEDIIPLTKKALELNPNLKLIASPWSAPGWMKTTGRMVGGNLREECYDVFSRYFVKFIKEYEAHGLNVYAVTPQNEALYMPANYSGCGMDAEVQAKLIAEYMGPAFRKNGIKTKILIYDHNWDRSDYPETVLNSKANEYVSGVAWHWYGGRPEAQTKVYRQFPDKEVYFTEGSGGDWIPPFDDAFFTIIHMGIEILRNYSRNFILWNMALDEKKGPIVPMFGTSTCRGVVLINQETRELTYNLDYYALAHFSKFTQAGAVRIESTQPEPVKSVAMLNPDKSIVVVLYNPDKENDYTVNIPLDGGKTLSYILPANSAATVLIREEKL